MTNERYAIYDFECKMSPALAQMLLTVINNFDWLAYEEETGEYDEGLLCYLAEHLNNFNKK